MPKLNSNLFLTTQRSKLTISHIDVYLIYVGPTNYFSYWRFPS